MKRTPLLRKTPLKAKSFMKRKAFKAKRTRIKPMSEKRKRESKEYSKLRIEFLTDNQECQVKKSCCTHASTDVHHMARRGRFYLVVSTWKAACRPCHDWIETHPMEAREEGFLM
jgi:hypothetical protein